MVQVRWELTRATRRLLLSGACLIGLAMATIPQEALASGKLRIWGALVYSDAANKAYEQAAREWGKTHDVEIEVSMVNTSEVIQKLSAAIEAGSLPDILDVNIEQLWLLSQKDLFLDVSSLFEELGNAQGGWLPSVAEATNTGSQQRPRIGIPFGVAGNMLLSRTDLLKEAGYERMPDTWDELIEASKKVSSAQLKGFGFAISNVGDANTLVAALHAFGGRIADDKGKAAAIKSDGTRAFLQWISDAWSSGVFPAGAATWDGAGDNQAYLSGLTAFVANTGSIALAAKTQDPELYEVTSLSPLPEGPNGRFSPINPLSRVISAKTAEKDAAMAFVRDFNDPGFLNAYYKDATYGPVYASQTDAEVFRQGDIVLKGLLDLALNGTAPAAPDVFNAAFGEVYANYVIPKMIQRVTVDKWTIDAAMGEAQVQIQRIYAKY